jgi:hypothetical protein
VDNGALDPVVLLLMLGSSEVQHLIEPSERFNRAVFPDEMT